MNPLNVKYINFILKANVAFTRITNFLLREETNENEITHSKTDGIKFL